MRRIYILLPALPHRATPSLQEQIKTQLKNDAQMPPLFRQGYQIQCKKEMVCDLGPKVATPTDEAARNPEEKKERRYTNATVKLLESRMRQLSMNGYS